MTDIQRITHLYARAGFGLDLASWQRAETTSWKNALQGLFQNASLAPLAAPSELRDLLAEAETMQDGERADLQELLKASQQIVSQINKNWLEELAFSNNSPLAQKMTFFWHGHFACIIKQPHLALQQLNIFRQHALGNFKDLTLAIAKDASMIRFLNNQQNRKDKPNENFARELLELFTMGRGHYSERDIKEAARAFTGWSSNLRGDFVFRKLQHDFGSKTFMGKTGNFNGEDIINLVFENPLTAQFIASKIYRFFVAEKPNPAHIQILAQAFYKSNYDIKTLLQTLFEAEWFYEKSVVGNRIKSPIELIVGTMRILNARFPAPENAIFLQRALGQVLFRPPNVAGWHSGKSWIDNSTLMVRLNLVPLLFKVAEVDLQLKGEFEDREKTAPVRRLDATLDLQALVSFFKQKTPEQAFSLMPSLLLPIGAKVPEMLLSASENMAGNEKWVEIALMQMMSLPEYQMC